MTTEASISEGLGSTRDEGQRKLTEEARRGSSLLRGIVICAGPAVSSAYSIASVVACGKTYEWKAVVASLGH